MSPEFKNEILSSFANMANEDLNLIGGVINFLNEDVEKETRLMILKSMQRNMSKRLDDLDIIIRKMEVETP
jgi:hypothetical protein